MAAKGARVRNDKRNNGKASKKNPRVFDATKRRLVSAK
jgi:hypothetical protein